MCTVTLRNRDQVCRELFAVERALMTSFGAETSMLLAQAEDLRGCLDVICDPGADDDSYGPARAA